MDRIPGVTRGIPACAAVVSAVNTVLADDNTFEIGPEEHGFQGEVRRSDSAPRCAPINRLHHRSHVADAITDIRRWKGHPIKIDRRAAGDRIEVNGKTCRMWRNR